MIKTTSAWVCLQDVRTLFRQGHQTRRVHCGCPRGKLTHSLHSLHSPHPLHSTSTTRSTRPSCRGMGGKQSKQGKRGLAAPPGNHIGIVSTQTHSDTLASAWSSGEAFLAVGRSKLIRAATAVRTWNLLGRVHIPVYLGCP